MVAAATLVSALILTADELLQEVRVRLRLRLRGRLRAGRATRLALTLTRNLTLTLTLCEDSGWSETPEESRLLLLCGLTAFHGQWILYRGAALFHARDPGEDSERSATIYP